MLLHSHFEVFEVLHLRSSLDQLCSQGTEEYGFGYIFGGGSSGFLEEYVKDRLDNQVTHMGIAFFFEV